MKTGMYISVKNPFLIAKLGKYLQLQYRERGHTYAPQMWWAFGASNVRIIFEIQILSCYEHAHSFGKGCESAIELMNQMSCTVLL